MALTQQEINNQNSNITHEYLKMYEKIDTEIRLLNEEIINLQDIEETLLTKINQEIENKRKIKDDLQKKVEELRYKCEELTKILNSFNQPETQN